MLTLEHLAALHRKYGPATATRVQEFSFGEGSIPFNSRPGIMGVINLSPDSWYRESVCLTAERAIQRGRVLAAQGADVIDLGAESTLAAAARVGSALQQSRLLPIVTALRDERIAVSVETYDPDVALAALKAGAKVLNLTGTEHAERIYPLAADYGAAVIICFVQGKHVREVDDYQLSQDPIGAMYPYFALQIELATQHKLTSILLDPGLGFYYRNLGDSAVRVAFQMKVFLNTFRLRTLGFPTCQALPHAFEYFGEEVRSAEPLFALLAALGGTDLFRTHEVPKIKAVLETLRVYADG